MSIAQHEGFRRALADSDYTASQAMAIISAIEAVEEFLAGCSQGGPSDCRVQRPSTQGQEQNPNSSDRPRLAGYACSESQQKPHAPSESSTSSSSQAQTAGEIMSGLYSTVQQSSAGINYLLGQQQSLTEWPGNLPDITEGQS